MINAREIAVDQIIPTPQNRRHIDVKSASWKEFVASIKQHGVLTPWLDTPDAIKAFAGKGGLLLAPLVTVFGTEHRANTRDSHFYSATLYPKGQLHDGKVWDSFDKLRAADSDLGLRCGAEQVLPVLRSRVKYFSLDDAAKAWDEAKRIGALVDHDMDAVLAAATAELPEPASWAREEAAPKRAKPAKPAKEAKRARPKSKAKAAK